MLQSLISLEDEEIDLVLTAVTRWCAERGVEADSAEGRVAMTAAVDMVRNQKAADLLESLSARLI